MTETQNPNQVRENEPADLGYAPPDPGQGDAASSEVPVGVDALSDEQIQAAEERSGGDGGDGDAIDVAAIMQEDGGELPAEAEAAAGEPADEAGDDATQKTDADAQAAADTGG